MMYKDQLEIINENQASPPVQTVPIAKGLGLKVFKSTTDAWPDALSGMIKRSSDDLSQYSIYVNGNHHVHRRRFTIAHEISHFILHKNLIGDGITDDVLYRSGLSSRVEAQANSLAADILMPWRLIREQLSGGIDNIEELAMKFRVSKSAMAIRLGVPYEK
ncbi:MAG: ImmA/IrrE family metallo-endopeptidase [Rhodobacteraceae bacterium]|nr:ImmA/IrrE family metallo-endopeptidase [Paracoccaceae bacterium]MCY4250594.1 ImmA/IrrE family metallo-endopeptidase [Paracoccaceae bacterium]MCY4309637.1 ImmA/IrrE family metallo-endopeptidase [Paracoccaceae bacterium]